MKQWFRVVVKATPKWPLIHNLTSRGGVTIHTHAYILVLDAPGNEAVQLLEFSYYWVTLNIKTYRGGTDHHIRKRSGIKHSVSIISDTHLVSRSLQHIFRTISIVNLQLFQTTRWSVAITPIRKNLQHLHKGPCCDISTQHVHSSVPFLLITFIISWVI